MNMSATSSQTVSSSGQLKFGGGTATPPVLILNLFHSGLAIARDLAGKHVRVIGLTADRRCFGNFTRFCEVRFAPNSQDEPQQLAEMLLQLSSELGGAVIFPTRDGDVVFLDNYRRELEPHYRLAIPSHECLSRVMNKHTLVTYAQRAGVPVPRTTLVRRASDLSRVETETGFPCVMKPVLAVNWRMGAAWNKVGCRKAIRIDNYQALCEEYSRVSAVDPEILVQQWIPGPAEQIVVCGGYVCGGEALASFTARKLVQSPDDFGTGCLVESDEIPEIAELSRRLWQELDYEGMAEVEYKYDAAAGVYRLIEINTRHWDWHQLGRASGVNLTWTAYSHLTGREVTRQTQKVARAKWIAEDALFTYLLTALYRRRIGPRQLWAKLAGPKIYSMFVWNDPLPFLRYAFSVLLPETAKAIYKKFVGGK